MDEEEREFFKNLPERLTIYRGYIVSKKPLSRNVYSNEKGISYTLSREQAEWFADRFVTDSGSEEPFVIEKTVNKSDCFAYLGSREEEIIYLKNRRVKKRNYRIYRELTVSDRGRFLRTQPALKSGK